jgi:hypothetical protein
MRKRCDGWTRCIASKGKHRGFYKNGLVSYTYLNVTKMIDLYHG